MVSPNVCSNNAVVFAAIKDRSSRSKQWSELYNHFQQRERSELLLLCEVAARTHSHSSWSIFSEFPSQEVVDVLLVDTKCILNCTVEVFVLFPVCHQPSNRW